MQDLSTSLNKFGSLKNLQRGQRPSAAAPFVGYYSAVTAVWAAALFTDVLTDVFTGVAVTAVFTDA